MLVDFDQLRNGSNPVENFAGRFVAMEAVLMALGSGFGTRIAFSHV